MTGEEPPEECGRKLYLNVRVLQLTRVQLCICREYKPEPFVLWGTGEEMSHLAGSGFSLTTVFL